MKEQTITNLQQHYQFGGNCETTTKKSWDEEQNKNLWQQCRIRDQNSAHT